MPRKPIKIQLIIQTENLKNTQNPITFKHKMKVVFTDDKEVQKKEYNEDSVCRKGSMEDSDPWSLAIHNLDLAIQNISEPARVKKRRNKRRKESGVVLVEKMKKLLMLNPERFESLVENGLIGDREKDILVEGISVCRGNIFENYSSKIILRLIFFWVCKWKPDHLKL